MHEFKNRENLYSFETRGKDLINGFHSAEIQPKLRRGAFTVFFENAIEIRDVVEAALIADFRNALARLQIERFIHGSDNART